MNDAPHRDAFTGVLLIASLVLLVLGLVFPAFTVEKFWLFDNEKSIAGAVVALLSGKNILLGIVILLFSIAFPLSKLVLYLWICASPDPRDRTTRHAL